LTNERIKWTISEERNSSLHPATIGDWIPGKQQTSCDLDRDVDKCAALFAGKRFAHAAQAADGILRQSPQNHRAAVLLGESHFKLGNYNKCVLALRSAIRIDPSDPTPLSTLAEALDRLGKLDQACDVLAELTTSSPSNISFWRHRCRVLYLCGRHQDLLEAFKAAPAGSKKDPPSVQYVAMALERLGASKQALALYRFVFEKQPHNKTVAAAIVHLSKVVRIGAR
jgi:cytochrome c-type biogenesis protein CcmH/NrfG